MAEERAAHRRGLSLRGPCQGLGYPDNAVMVDSFESPSVALAHHWMMSMRGGEKVLSVLAGLYPDAPIYTLVARRDQLDPVLAGRRIETSWLQRLVWIPDVQRKAMPVLFAAARSLDARSYDAVICSDAASIKALRTRPDALKLCYCHSPMRYVWHLYSQYYAGAGLLGRLGLRLFAGRIRRADRRAAGEVAAFVANSRPVANRIRRNYGRPSVVIPPPVDTDYLPNEAPAEDFYLVVGEQVGYKRNDLAVAACTRLGRPLVVIGTGPLLGEVRRVAGPSVRVLGWQADQVVREHFRRCRAVLFCGEEDFGMVPVEAQAAGRPVIAFGAGGVLDTVQEGRSGLFFHKQDPETVIDALERFESAPSLWSPRQIQDHARQFSIARFRQRFSRFWRWCLDQCRAGGARQVRDAMETIDRDAFLSFPTSFPSPAGGRRMPAEGQRTREPGAPGLLAPDG